MSVEVDFDRVRKLSALDLRDAAWSPALGFQPMLSPRRGESIGSQQIVNLADDVLLVRTNYHSMDQSRWELDMRGWIYLHYRLEGVSEEESPTGGAHGRLDGDCFLLSASRSPCARNSRGGLWRAVGILCRPSFVTRELSIAPEHFPGDLQSLLAEDLDTDYRYADRLTKDMRAVVTCLLQPNVHHSILSVYLRAKVTELVLLTLEHLRHAAPAEENRFRLTDRDAQRLRQARRVLHEHTQAPSLEQLARLVGINRCKLAVGFKHLFGLTIGEYHRDLRLERARELLEARELSVGRVATAVGYADAGSFSKAFRARYGHLPSQVQPKITPARKE